MTDKMPYLRFVLRQEAKWLEYGRDQTFMLWEELNSKFITWEDHERKLFEFQFKWGKMQEYPEYAEGEYND